MNDEREAELIQELAKAEEQVKSLGNNVATLKKGGAAADAVSAAVAELNAAKANATKIVRKNSNLNCISHMIRILYNN